MKILRKITFDEVVQQFRSEHPVESIYEENTNQDAEKHLQMANELFGEWKNVLLERKDILQIILPWHLGCKGKQTLVPKSGLTVEQTVNKLSEIKDSYSQDNPVCWHKIKRMRDAELTPLFLSSAAILHQDYSEIAIAGNLFHLDGLHRMVSWEFHGILNEDIQVEAYVAGKL